MRFRLRPAAFGVSIGTFRGASRLSIEGDGSRDAQPLRPPFRPCGKQMPADPEAGRWEHYAYGKSKAFRD